MLDTFFFVSPTTSTSYYNIIQCGLLVHTNGFMFEAPYSLVPVDYNLIFPFFFTTVYLVQYNSMIAFNCAVQ